MGKFKERWFSLANWYLHFISLRNGKTDWIFVFALEMDVIVSADRQLYMQDCEITGKLGIFYLEFYFWDNLELISVAEYFGAARGDWLTARSKGRERSEMRRDIMLCGFEGGPSK